MNFDEKFKFGVGILLLCEGISGIILYFIFFDVAFIVLGIILTILGVFLLWILITKEITGIIKEGYWGEIGFIIACFLFGILFIFGDFYGRSEVFKYYLSGLFLSWGVLSVYWILRDKFKKENKN